MNVIWNAAGDYDFDSPFLAFHPNGLPDSYFNLVIGLTKKWLDLWKIAAFFDKLGEGPASDEASAVLWLGIENCVYGKELPVRPVLEQLRKKRAEQFFEISQTLSRQQMMLQSMKVYDQENLRWSRVLDKNVLTAGPRAVKLARALEFSPQLDTEQVLGMMEQIVQDFFRIRMSGKSGQRMNPVSGLKRTLAGALLRHERHAVDLMVLRHGSGCGDEAGSVHLTHNRGEIHTSRDPEKDRAYIRGAFGPCLYSEAEMRILEHELCAQHDASCRLWFAKADTKEQADEAGRQLRADIEAQKEKNLRFFQEHIFQIKESIRNLTAQTDTIFSSYLRYLPQKAQRGKLDGRLVWRLPVLSDPDVFLSDSDMAEYTLRVDLLLDASQSRMNSQEIIASQAYVIAKSFENCHIPVRVSAFRSLRGYTVIQRLKDYGDRRCEGSFHYFAGGWNRDGLCLKAMEYIMTEEKKGNGMKRILLVLTDANPNDSVPIPPGKEGFLSREYEGSVAVQDAADAVRRLRKSGVKTGAVYYGSSSHLDAVHQIYGQEYVRILNLNQLAEAVGSLLKRSLSEMPSEKG